MFKEKLKLDTKGLSGDTLKAAEAWNAKIDAMTDDMFLDKKTLQLSLKEIFADFFDAEGKLTLNVKEINEQLGASEKGLRKIVENLGAEVTALKEKGGVKEVRTFKVVLDEKMADVEKIVKAKQGEVRLTVKAAAVMTSDAAIADDDLLPDQTIESFSTAAFVPKRFPREYVFDIANRNTVAEVAETKIWLEEGDTEGAFAEIAEGEVKPLMSAGLVRNFSQVQKVAGKIVVTEEFAKFRKTAYALIRNIINQKVLRDYAAILTNRLLADAAVYVSSALDGQYENPTDYHAIAAVAAQIEALDFAPDLLILNPQDKWRIGMLQDNNGQFFLTIPVTDPSGSTRMMGFNVRTSNRVAVGQFILGESGLWNIEDEALSVRMGYGIEVTKTGGNVTDVSSDFDNNRFRVIVETFFHTWIGSNNAGSFVKATFATVKAALQSA